MSEEKKVLRELIPNFDDLDPDIKKVALENIYRRHKPWHYVDEELLKELEKEHERYIKNKRVNK